MKDLLVILILILAFLSMGSFVDVYKRQGQSKRDGTAD